MILNHRIGLGTYHYGDRLERAPIEIAAIRHAFECGYRLIDTAEMYANGESEIRVGQAIREIGFSRRDSLTIVTKVRPDKASRNEVQKSCEESLRRLKLEYVDVLLLHWPGEYQYQETLEGFAALRDRGLIKSWGVSSFDVDRYNDWKSVETGMGLNNLDLGGGVVTNQVAYNLKNRGIEFDLLPLMQSDSIPVMAYSPLGSGHLIKDPRLVAVANDLGITVAQLALAWVTRHNGVIAIPKSITACRIKENMAALDIILSAETISRLDGIFEPPSCKVELVR